MTRDRIIDILTGVWLALALGLVILPAGSIFWQAVNGDLVNDALVGMVVCLMVVGFIYALLGVIRRTLRGDL